MRKKLLSLLLICLCILGLTACGEDPRTVDYNGRTYEELEQAATATWQGIQSMDLNQLALVVEQIESMSEAEQIAVFEANKGMEEQLALVKSWINVSKEVGNFIDVGSFEITRTGKTTTTDLILNFEKRPVMLSIVYKNRDMSVETTTVDLVYTTGEKMQKAALNTVMGMGTVFVMLIVICLIISCFSVIPRIEKKLKGDSSQKPQAAAPAQTARIPVSEPVRETDDLELAAVIAAAIAAATGQSTDDFVVRSIKRR